MKKIIPFVIIALIPFIFFWQFFIKDLLPIPSDTIIGLYHPFRDLYAKDYPRGIPFKNFLITDPVRQQYPWKELAIETEKKLELPLWNPYNFSGTPLAANFQSAVFYPLNLLFFIMPFYWAWSFLIFLAPLLAGIFLYLYLQSLRLNKWASVLGSISFSFSGFFVSWLEWGNVLHTALWLPLVLLSIDKIVSSIKYPVSSIKNRNSLIWSFIFVFSLTSSFLAGHLQIFFYLFVFSFIYFFARWMQVGWQKKILFLFIILNSLFIILSSIQWFPTLQLILLSARDIDQVRWGEGGWFIPWQHIIQFVAPDFFGNPTTLNYWSVFNYGEFIGYVGIIPLIFSLYALFLRRDKKTFLFGSLFFISLIFSLPTIFAKIPFFLNIPLLNTSAPTRLLSVTDFSLAVLCALGLDYFLKTKNKKEIIYPVLSLMIIFLGIWIFILLGNKNLKLITEENLLVSKNNFILPSILLIVSSILIFLFIFIKKIPSYFRLFFIFFILIITVFDLLRFSWKYNSFTKKGYLFPDTEAMSFLKKNIGFSRFMNADSRILPPNFSSIYRLQSVEGYDPLYLKRYAELIAASERGTGNINPPFGFNRIITPHNYESKIIDLLGVKYILSLSDITSDKLTKVFQEGETRIYENKEVLPKVFFVRKIQTVRSKDEAIKEIFNKDFSPRNTAIVELPAGVNINPPLGWTNGRADIVEYSANKVVIKTENKSQGFLVLTDSFYPTWRAKIDGNKTKIYRTDYNFRGIFVPKGKHTIEFYVTLL